ncbi:DUF4412 domain-containing protein [Hwangdonia lutea]|uniref:DUF4412 domain-containing protein n=1 Tax=Hwangdonia lutea TaxID=3075823 RepID=A0AA97EPK8_9FLAO|nr:DUF4412 domain-containing protein [Hwangdonia sp. SCSIO 19198]WOD43808.1 DUF4412 domain-containing protein [Hwangdonia sp. SCSIO 19198]
MKTKFIILITLCFFFSMPVKAQDPTKKIMQGLLGKGKLDESKLPDAYTFDWEFKTEIKTAKNDPMQMDYLINSNSKNYFGMVMSSKELKGKGTMRIVMDSKEKISIMFMNMNGQNMAQMTKIKDQKSSKKEPKYSFKEIGTKTILGYTCYGMQMENADFITNVYFTLDAPVNFSAFFAFSNNKNNPKGFDPALLKVLEEDALLMEINAQHKKKKKQSFTMTAISLKEKKTEIKKEDYQFMSFGMGF